MKHICITELTAPVFLTQCFFWVIILTFNSLKNLDICLSGSRFFRVQVLIFLCSNEFCTIHLACFLDRGGEGQKALPPTHFSPRNFNKLQLAPKTFWLLVLTLLPYWGNISSSYLVQFPNYWTWTRTNPKKEWFSWSDPYEIEVMITSQKDFHLFHLKENWSTKS